MSDDLCGHEDCDMEDCIFDENEDHTEKPCTCKGCQE